MNVHVKICGITRYDDAVLAEELGASAVGFVFYRGSPRYIEPDKARPISDALGPFIARVGVFVDEDPAVVLKTVATAGLTVVQLHGSEDPEYVLQLNEYCAAGKLSVVKAFRVGPDFNTMEFGRYSVSAYLLDTCEKGQYGGTGKTFDWKLALPCGKYGKIILAGGLCADNITEAVSIVKPWGVDVSSGIEQKPGIKDHKKMKQFFEAIQRESTG